MNFRLAGVARAARLDAKRILTRFPLAWTHASDKKSRQANKLGRGPIEKACQLF
jgi:hypothetical protein